MNIMNLFQKALREVRVVPTIGAVVIGGLVAFLVTQYPDDPRAQLRDGITFEQDGTALAGRESAEGWLDLKCDEAGRVTVEVVNSQGWEVINKGRFDHPACDDRELQTGEISLSDIPERLRG